MQLIRVALLAFAATLPVAAHSQQYPSRPIRIIVPFPPGNILDIMTRLIAPKLAERLGQNVIVDNRAGASGMLGLELAMRATADGHTLVGGQGSNLVVVPHMHKKVPYDAIKDFSPIALSATNYQGLAVHPGVPFKSMQDLIAYAKANPGKLSFATGGQFDWAYMTLELLRRMAGFSYLQVPYKGGEQAVMEVIGGQVNGVVLGTTVLAPHIRSGKVRLLGVTSPTRVPQFPDVPAIAESVPGFDSRGWFGYLAPAGAPREIVMLLNREINRAMALPEIREKLESAGLTILTEPPAYFTQTIKSSHEKYGRIIREFENSRPQ